MMLRPLHVRPAIFVLTLVLASAVSACNSGGDNAQSPARNTNSSASPTPAAASSPGATTNESAAAYTNTANDAGKPKLNLNTASENDFMTGVPNLGKRMAHEFEEYRPYRSIQQFRREMSKYVGAEQIAEYEKYVFVPISPNESDAPTLQQIPGLDATEAQALIAARPYASPDAFLARLAEKVSPQELATAKSYLNAQ